MTNRILAISFAAILAGTLSVSAQSRTGDSSAGSRRVSKADLAGVRSSLASGSARALLRKRVSEVDWDESPLEDVVEWIRDQGEDKVNIVFRWTALQNDAIDRDSPITMQLRGITVGDVLIELVDQMSPTGGVTFHGMDNRLTVSTKADLNRKMYVRVYQVTDILFHTPDLGRSAPVVDLDKAARSSRGGGGQSIFSGSGGSNTEDLEEDEQEIEERMDELVDLITQTVAPDSWDLEDGTGTGAGRIRVFDDRFLVVRNTVEVHEALAGFFSLKE